MHSVCCEHLQKHHWECCVHGLSGQLGLSSWQSCPVQLSLCRGVLWSKRKLLHRVSDKHIFIWSRQRELSGMSS